MRTVIVAVVGVLSCAIGCEAADPYGDLPALTPAASTASPTSATCTEPTDGRDPSTLPECTGTKGNAKGRCVARAELGSFKDTFEQASCGAELACVPDEVVKKGTKIELTKCIGVGKSEGRCFWPLAKDIVSNYAMLKEATSAPCGADQVCAPCNHPVTGASTRVCSTGSSAGSCGGDAGAAPAPAPAKAMETCCGGRARCVSTELVPEDSRKMLAADTCKGDAPLCAPAEFLSLPGVTPNKCKTILGLIDGICLPKCAIESKLENFVPGGCAEDELCAPCRMLPAGTEACAKP